MDALYLVINYSTVYSKSVLYEMCTANLMCSFLQEPYKRSVNCDRVKLFKSMRFLRRTGNCQKEEIKFSIYNFFFPFDTYSKRQRKSKRGVKILFHVTKNVGGNLQFEFKRR